MKLLLHQKSLRAFISIRRERIQRNDTLRPRKREREMATKTLKVARKVWVSNGASKVSKSKRGWIRGRIERIAAAEVERAEEAVAAEVQERQ